MKAVHLFCLWLLFMPAGKVSAQLVDRVLDALHQDSLPVAVKVDSDSIRLSALKEELAAAKLNEANLRMEMEQMKLLSYAADSVKLAGQKLRIDSLRKMTPGVPVVVEGDTLFYLYAKRGGHTPQHVLSLYRLILPHWEDVSICIPTPSI